MIDPSTAACQEEASKGPILPPCRLRIGQRCPSLKSRSPQAEMQTPLRQPR
jgi:hypothetical protein